MTLIYHGIPAVDDSNFDDVVFERHVRFLKRYFELVSQPDTDRPRQPGAKGRVLLTFDDGFRNNAEIVAPILRKYEAPAIFFISSRHATPGKYLWFSYLCALERHFPGSALSFRGELFNMSQSERQRSIQQLRKRLLGMIPHPAAMYNAIEDDLPPLEDFVSETDLARSYAGMSAEQVAELAADPLFAVGVHTIDHPFLTRCEAAEVSRQIEGNRAWLENASGRKCDTIAYPNGDYDSNLLNACHQAGFARGYVVSRRTVAASRLELQRIGIYSESTDVLGFKVQWGNALRALQIQFG